MSKREQKWNNFNQNLLEDISFLKWAQQPKAKAMLSIKEFGFTADTREVFIKGKEKLTSRPLLDYLSTATRMAGPNECPDKIFVLYTKLLRAKKIVLIKIVPSILQTVALVENHAFHQIIEVFEIRLLLSVG